MRIIDTKVYTIDEHPDKEKCYEWIRANWYDLNEYSIYELIDSIKKLSEVIGGTVDYSVGQFPDRGEHITFVDYDQEILESLNSDELPLTGVYWDSVLIDALKEGSATKVLKHLHEESEYQYSDKGLYEFCASNEYEFDETGKFI